MKQRYKYILSSLIVLSIVGLGENIFIPGSNVKHYIETEWLSTTHSKVEDSKCCYYNQYPEVVAAKLNIKLWSRECNLYYNRSVNVKYIAQANMFCELSVMNFLIHKSYIPRKSIENYPIS